MMRDSHPHKMHTNDSQNQILLAHQAAMWATPQARDYHSVGEMVNERPQWEHGLNSQAYRFGLQAPETPTPGSESSPGTPTSHLRLNPNFVEWLMGLPPKWISLEPIESINYERWATAWFPKQ